jgi:hypothetical protein
MELIQRRKTMKVRELIERLEQEDQEADVHFAYDYGDYWHTTVAAKVRNVEAAYVKRSDYHKMMKLVNVDLEEDDREELTMVVCLFATV